MPRRPSPDEKPQVVTDALLRGWPLPDPEKAASKEDRGRVIIIAGAVEMPGTAILASTASLRAGAGKVRVAIAESAALAVAAAVPELFVLGIADGKRRDESVRAILHSAQNAAAVLIGPGMRDVELIRALLPELLQIESLHGLIIDATAIKPAAEFLPARGKLFGKAIITPHAAEMAALADIAPDEVKRDPLRVARETARRLGCVVVLKGKETHICPPEGQIYLNKRGNAGLATAGSGDVLAGILAGFSARGAEPPQAAVWAVSTHARAGENLAREVGPVGFLAREILDQIPRVNSALI